MGGMTILERLPGTAPDGGLWNGGKVAKWISELIAQPVARHRGWEYLRQMTFRLRVPRPAHEEADPVEQEEWKKKLALVVAKIKRASTGSSGIGDHG